MPYTPILATLGYVRSPDSRRVLMIHRNARGDDHHLGKYNGLGGKLEGNEDVAAGMRREIREEAAIEGLQVIVPRRRRARDWMAASSQPACAAKSARKRPSSASI